MRYIKEILFIVVIVLVGMIAININMVIENKMDEAYEQGKIDTYQDAFDQIRGVGSFRFPVDDAETGTKGIMNLVLPQ